MDFAFRTQDPLNCHYFVFEKCLGYHGKWYSECRDVIMDILF